MRTYQLLAKTSRPFLFSNTPGLRAIRTYMMTTRLSKEPRRFAPLGGGVDKLAEGLPKLKGIVFDVDGTLWWVWSLLLYFGMLVSSLQLVGRLWRVLRSFLDRDKSNRSRSVISSFSEHSSTASGCFRTFWCSILCAVGVDRPKIELNHVLKVSGTVYWRDLMNLAILFWAWK